MDSIFTNHSYNFTIYIRLIYWLTVLLGITVSLNICCIQSDWIDIKLAFIYTWKLYYPRQKKTGPLPGDSTIFQSSLSTPPPPIKHASFSDLPWVPGNFLAQFPDFRPPSLTSSPPYSLEIPRIWRSHAPFSAAWAWGSTSLRYISYPVSRRKISLRRPKEHLTRSRDFCTINSFICCSFLCRDQHVSHTEPFGSVLFLVLLSFTCSW